MEPGWRDIVYWSQIIIQRPHKKKATQDQLPFPLTEQHSHPTTLSHGKPKRKGQNKGNNKRRKRGPHGEALPTRAKQRTNTTTGTGMNIEGPIAAQLSSPDNPPNAIPPAHPEQPQLERLSSQEQSFGDPTEDDAPPRHEVEQRSPQDPSPSRLQRMDLRKTWHATPILNHSRLLRHQSQQGGRLPPIPRFRRHRTR